MAIVALLGVPIVAKKHEDGDGVYSIDYFYRKGATDRPRKDFEVLLRQACSKIIIKDLGELGSGFFTTGKIDYEELGLDAQQVVTSSGADVVLAIGGDHAAAFPFYSMQGQVVRADAHGDAYVQKNLPLSSYMITGATYMAFVDSLGLKKPHQVWNVGVEMLHLRQEYRTKDGVFGALVDVSQMLRHPLSNTGFFDIDVDVLASAYRLPHWHSTSNLRAEDLADLVIKLQPKVVGLFECVGKSGNIPYDIVSAYPSVFGPICEAVAQAAVARSIGTHANLQSPQAFSVTYH